MLNKSSKKLCTYIAIIDIVSWSIDVLYRFKRCNFDRAMMWTKPLGYTRLQLSKSSSEKNKQLINEQLKG